MQSVSSNGKVEAKREGTFLRGSVRNYQCVVLYKLVSFLSVRKKSKYPSVKEALLEESVQENAVEFPSIG